MDEKIETPLCLSTHKWLHDAGARSQIFSDVSIKYNGECGKFPGTNQRMSVKLEHGPYCQRCPKFAVCELPLHSQPENMDEKLEIMYALEESLKESLKAAKERRIAYIAEICRRRRLMCL